MDPNPIFLRAYKNFQHFLRAHERCAYGSLRRRWWSSLRPWLLASVGFLFEFLGFWFFLLVSPWWLISIGFGFVAPRAFTRIQMMGASVFCSNWSSCSAWPIPCTSTVSYPVDFFFRVLIFFRFTLWFEITHRSMVALFFFVCHDLVWFLLARSYIVV